MRHVLRLALVPLALLALSGPAWAGEVRVIVGFKGAADATLVARHGGEAGVAIPSARALAAVVPAARVAALRADPDVAYVEEDGVAEAFGGKGKPGQPSEPPSQSTPWGIARVGGGLTTQTGAGVHVAIVDTGIDLDHPDLADNVGAGATFVSRTSTPEDDNGHGSHVAGTVGAVDNSIGVIGVAPEATLHPVKVLDRRGSGYWSAVAAGVDWCADNGMDIANMSLGGAAAPTALKDSCDAAYADGVLLIAAAGNEGDGSLVSNEISYPAYYSSVVSVGATDSNDALASFSNTNVDVELSGPGVGVLSTYKGGAYATGSGTSMASPHAAGVAALYWAAAGSPTPATVLATLKANAVDKGATGQDRGYGVGIVLYK